MAYRDIVVHLAQDERSAARLDAAVALAEGHESRLTGIYVLTRLPIPGYASFDLSPEVLKRLDTEQRAHAESAERQFAERLAKSTVPSEWRLMTGEPVDAVTTSARYADLTIVGQTDPDDSRNVGGLADSVVLSAGGPVLVWPYAGSFALSLQTVMLAWNGTREAKRALSDAMPLLEQAREVVIMGVDTDDGRHTPGAEVGAHLARHGMHVEARHTATAPGVSTGDTLLCEIGDRGIGLLVMGGYGHPRVRKRLLGGVTRDILRHMTVPVLMSH